MPVGEYEVPAGDEVLAGKGAWWECCEFVVDAGLDDVVVGKLVRGGRCESGVLRIAVKGAQRGGICGR